MSSHKKNAGAEQNRRRNSKAQNLPPTKTNAWDKLKLDNLARKYFIDTLVNTDGFTANGFSAPYRNGKPIRYKDLQVSTGNSTNSQKKKATPGTLVGTSLETNLTTADRKRSCKLFATRFSPNVNILNVKSELERKLKTTTGKDHVINVERVQSKFDSYSSFKITCLCTDISALYNPSIWPKDCFVKRWIEPRNSRGGIVGGATF